MSEEKKPLLDPNCGLPLVEERPGKFHCQKTGSSYFLINEKLIELRDRNTGEMLIEQEDGTFTGIASNKSYSFLTLSEGEDPRFFPDFLPYSIMENVNARVENGRLVGDNGISFPIVNGYIDTPIQEGLTTQEEIDADISDKNRYSDIVLTNAENEIENQKAQISYQGNLENCDIYRNMIVQRAAILGLSIADCLDDFMTKNPQGVEDFAKLTGTSIVLDPQVKGRPLTIEDYILSPEAPTFKKPIPMPEDLQQRVNERYERNDEFYEKEDKMQSLLIKTRTSVNEKRFISSNIIATNEKLTSEEAAKLMNESRMFGVNQFRNFINTYMEVQGLDIQTVMTMHSDILKTHGIDFNLAPKAKEDGTPLTVEDYIPDPPLVNALQESKGKPLTDSKVYNSSKGIENVWGAAKNQVSKIMDVIRGKNTEKETEYGDK